MFTKRTFSVFEKPQIIINLKSIDRDYLHNKGMQYETYFDSSNRLIKSLNICWNVCSTCNYYYYSTDDKIEKIVTIYTSISDEYIVDLFVFEYSEKQISEKKINIENDSLSYGSYEKFEYKNVDYLEKVMKQKPIQDFKIYKISDFSFEKYQPILFSDEIDFKNMVDYNKMDLFDKETDFNIFLNPENNMKFKIDNSGFLIEQSKSKSGETENYGYLKNNLCHIGNSSNIISIHFEKKSNKKSEIGLITNLNNYEVRKLYSISEEKIRSVD